MHAKKPKQAREGVGAAPGCPGSACIRGSNVAREQGFKMNIKLSSCEAVNREPLAAALGGVIPENKTSPS